MTASEEHKSRRRMRALYVALAVTVVLIPALALMYAQAFGPVTGDVQTYESFVVEPNDSASEIARTLHNTGFIKNEWTFLLTLSAAGGRERVRPGGFEISPSMDLFQIARILTDSPYLVWFEIPPGLRKEEIAERLALALSWTTKDTRTFEDGTLLSEDLSDGMYFPDLYLIPSDQPPEKIAKRMQDRFREVFAPYAHEAGEKNVKWTDVVTLASLIEREAAGPEDRRLISGIIWNRIARGMPLGIDATLQYIKGEEGNWWPAVTGEDKYLESPYNTYFESGLPPGPIANPGLDAIKAAVNPEKTSCLYYLHDENGRIHCATTYRAHVANVNRYLR